MNGFFLSYAQQNSALFHDVKIISIDSWEDIDGYVPINEIMRNFVITSFSSGHDSFKFFEVKGENKGFLTQLREFNDVINSPVINDLHFRMYTNMGCIIESNLNDLMAESYLDIFNIDNRIFGLDFLQEDYIEKCNNLMIPVNSDLMRLTTIATEANGNLIQYSPEGNMFFYLKDHEISNTGFTSCDNTPPNTFYTHENIRTVEDWVIRYLSYYLR